MLKYTALWEIIMKEFDPIQFLFMGGIHSARKVATGVGGDSNLTEDEKQRDSNDADKAEYLCHVWGFEFSEMAAKRIKDFIAKNAQVSANDLVRLFDEFDNRIIDEAKSKKFFSIESGKEVLLDGRNQFGEAVINAFPSAIIDIEEAGKCLAFERATACVFHLMRVMEIGLKVIGKSLNDPNLMATTNKSWNIILQKSEKELQKPLAGRSPEWAKDDSFFASAIAMLRAVKDAWRNPTMHVENIYTEEQAEDIWNAVRGFMRHLATKLKE
jgi:hypothetical protein